MGKASWMGKVKKPDQEVERAPATRIEAVLEDLKGRPLTSRVLKDDWGNGNRIDMNKIIENVANEPGMNQDDISMTKGRGFTPAGTTTDKNPSKVTRVEKKMARRPLGR